MKDKERVETSLKAAKECINAALKNLKKDDEGRMKVAIFNAQECLKTAVRNS